MAMIVPTVEIIGDEALTNSIIDRSITELSDVLLTSIATSTFDNCNSLKKLVLGSVTNLPNDCFSGDSHLEHVDLHSVTSMNQRALRSCTGIVALILRSNTVCTIQSGTLTSSSIANGTGFVYVPRALVDSYKAASNWSTYAAQIRAIEDYPEVCDPYSWEAVAAAISANTYKDVYKIGDMIPVDLGSEGVINMQIAAFDTDTLADGSGTAAISWIGKELLATTHRMNPAREGSSGAYTEGTGSVGGWEKCEMRAYLKETIKPLIPSAVLDIIQTVSKTQPSFGPTTSSSSANTVTQTTADDVWIPATSEMKTGIYAALFPDNTSLIKVKSGTTSKVNWWYRTAGVTCDKFYRNYGNVNGQSSIDATNVYGVCLGFCTGKTPT